VFSYCVVELRPQAGVAIGFAAQGKCSHVAAIHGPLGQIQGKLDTAPFDFLLTPFDLRIHKPAKPPCYRAKSNSPAQFSALRRHSHRFSRW
jgi:hypothetical protein